MFTSIRWRIAVPYVLLILVVMGVLSGYLSVFVRDMYIDGLEERLASNLVLIGNALSPAPSEALATGEYLDDAAREYAELTGARITIIAGDGTVVGESDDDRTRMDNHANRPEVIAALSQERGSSIRHSKTVDLDMLYVALPVAREDGTVDVVRAALPLASVEKHVGELSRTTLLAALVAVLLAAVLATVIAERTTQPVRRLTQAAEDMAEGRLDRRILITSRDEIGTLARALNKTAQVLQDTISTLAAEQGHLQAILEHMADGVIITDEMGQVSLINPAAGQLLETTQELALKRTFAQVVRDHRLIALWEECRRQGDGQSKVIEMETRQIFLQAIITPFPENRTSSYLVILQDLTSIRRLQTVRRDFISNISHELRTPLAGLKALVDTLRDGAMDDPPAAERFLNRIEVEVDSMTQMVEELLELSRIESGQVPVELVPTALSEVVVDAAERLRPQAERAGLDLIIEMDPNLPRVVADPTRIRQVITNLVHNAIKFTPADGVVHVSAVTSSSDVIVSVRDTGVGIPREDLPRIFERFFKADRARSGGGTGLGLAISKHIIQAHGGRIWVESDEGRGSTFYFALPVVNPVLTSH